jgi:glycosyltransferase involved in cell wall biosynthesis
MILVDSIYTNVSGSKRLLEYFIRHAQATGALGRYFFIFDSRLDSPVTQFVSKENFVRLVAREGERKKFYQSLPDTIEKVFCFGSVPPPVNVSDRPVLILQHNPFFFENPLYGLYHKFVYLIKRLYIRRNTQTSYEWVVQTPRIKNILQNVLNVAPEKIHIIPFFEPIPISTRQRVQRMSPSFIYVADGVPQKNHKLLFKVWEQLADEGIRPALHLTVPDKFKSLVLQIDALRKKGVDITNHGFLSREELAKLYAENQYLVFPSMSESLGLPLVEAVQAGLKVIGSDMEFLYQVITPSAVFHPLKPESLAVIVKDIMSNKVTLPESKIVIGNDLPALVELVNRNTQVHDKR